MNANRQQSLVKSRMTWVGLLIAALLTCQMLVPPGETHAANYTTYYGVNLAGAEFGKQNLPGQYGVDYIYPTHEEIDYYASKGMNVIRLPFLWERVQNQLWADLDSFNMSKIDDFVNYAKGKGITTILDPHNYGRYYGQVIGAPGSGVSAEAFANLWTRLAERYKNNPNVIFGIMNEPHDMSTEVWLNDAQKAMDAIRNTGATNLVLVPGNAWTGAWSWDQTWYGSSNASVMNNITDPINNFAYEVHQYFDTDHSGYADTDNSHSFRDHLVNFTNWCKANGKRAFLGEYNFSDNNQSAWLADEMLSYLDQNTDVWLGHAYWAGGPWWGDSAPRVLTPSPLIGGADRPQMATILKHIPGGVSGSSFFTGFEPGQPAPTWNDTVDWSLNVGGYCCGVAGMESSPRQEAAYSGSNALMYSGNDASASASYSYNKVFDVNISVTSSTQLNYRIHPQSSNGRYVAIDMIFTDGSNLRDSGVVDQHGVYVHPFSQGAGGHLAINQWNLVSANIGQLAGKTIDRILVAYDQPGNTGGYRGYIDDLHIQH